MRHGLLSLFIFLTLAGCAPEQAAQNPQPPHHAVMRHPLACVLSLAPATAPGGDAGLDIALTNLADHDVLLVPAIDGSDVGRRYPQGYFTVTDSTGKDIPMLPVTVTEYCEPLSDADFTQVPPGFTLRWPVELFTAAGIVKRHTAAPGVYQLRFVYSTESDSPDEWLGNGLSAKGLREDREHFGPMITRVPRTTVTSNAVTVTLR